jgi:hypothetical protein
LLATGVCSQALASYLTRDLGFKVSDLDMSENDDGYRSHFQELQQQGLRKWEKSAEAGYSDVIKMVTCFLQPACLRLLAYLSDLAGDSRW